MGALRAGVNVAGSTVLRALAPINAVMSAGQTLTDPRMIEASAGTDAGFGDLVKVGLQDALSGATAGLTPRATESRIDNAEGEAGVQAMRELATNDPAFAAWARTNLRRAPGKGSFGEMTPDQWNATTVQRLKALQMNGTGDVGRQATSYFEQIYPARAAAANAEQQRQVQAMSRPQEDVYGSGAASSTLSGINSVPGFDANPAGLAADAAARAAPQSAIAGPVAAPAPTNDGAVLGQFNGRDVTQGEADRLAQRNVIPAEFFTNPGIGVATSMATGGQTLEMGEAARLKNERAGAQSRNAATLQRANEAIARRGQDNGNGHSDELINRAEEAIGRGKRKSAAAYTALAGVANASQRSAPNAAAQQNVADPMQRQKAIAELAGSESLAKQRAAQAITAQNEQALQAELLSGDPVRAEAATKALAAMKGRTQTKGKRQIVYQEIPDSTGLSTIRIPFDVETGDPVGNDAMLDRFSALLAPPPKEK